MVVFPASDTGEWHIKRVIGLSGETRTVYIDGDAIVGKAVAQYFPQIRKLPLDRPVLEESL